MSVNSPPFICRMRYSKWLLIPFFLLITWPIARFIPWLFFYYYEYFTTPQLAGLHLLPDRERWCVLTNAIKPTRQIERNRISLILHMSSDYLSEDIAEQFINWSGPVALSIVLNDADKFNCTNQFMRSLIDGHGSVGGMVQVHYLYKKDHFGRCKLNLENDRNSTRLTKVNCSLAARGRSIGEIADYPMNMARNVARQFVKTRFILLSDVDLLFSEGFERRMAQVATRELHEARKRVLVFRIFEVYSKTSTPRTKSKLAELFGTGKADVFHVVSAYGHHELAGRAEWLAKPENFTHTKLVPGRIRYTRYTWEPRFVGLSTVPLHDEAFPYRIRANNGWELCRAGYDFALVEDLFTFHRAKRVSDEERQNENNNIQLMNRLKYERALSQWHTRMDSEYPDTKRSCPAILNNRLFYFTEE